MPEIQAICGLEYEAPLATSFIRRLNVKTKIFDVGTSEKLKKDVYK